MADYNFITTWKFDAPIEKVYNAIHDADNYPKWWKGQLKVESIIQGDELGVGAVKRFTTRGALPYSLSFNSRVEEVIPQKKIRGTAYGELDGEGIWEFENENGITTVKYYWTVKTTTFWMNLFAPLLKPLFEWNHDVVMRWGEKGLAKYLGCNLISPEM